MPGLSPQREKFAQAGASGMNQSDAYRAAYRVRHGTTMVFVNQSASRVMYVDVIVRRWQEFTGKRAVLESTGQQFPDEAPAIAA